MYETIKRLYAKTKNKSVVEKALAKGWITDAEKNAPPAEEAELKVKNANKTMIEAAVAVLSYILGEHWFLFVLFLLLNAIDWGTGWMKSRINNVENSKAGLKGVLKKLGYWLMIMVSFGASAAFV